MFKKNWKKTKAYLHHYNFYLLFFILIVPYSEFYLYLFTNHVPYIMLKGVIFERLCGFPFTFFYIFNILFIVIIHIIWRI